MSFKNVINDTIDYGSIFTKHIANMTFKLEGESNDFVSLRVYSYDTLIFKIVFKSDFSNYVDCGFLDLSYYSRTTSRHQGICAWLEIYFKVECFKQPEKRIEMLEKIFTEYRALRDFGYMSKVERREWVFIS